MTDQEILPERLGGGAPYTHFGEVWSWIVYAYILVSLIVAVWCLFHKELGAAFATLGSSALAIVAGGGTRGGLGGDRNQVLGGRSLDSRCWQPPCGSAGGTPWASTGCASAAGSGP
jgi:hypothetical protein